MMSLPKKIREKYLIHLTKMFELLKDEPAVAEKNAETIMKNGNTVGKSFFYQCGKSGSSENL